MEGEYGGPAEGTFVMMESGKMMEDWEDLMRMEPPKPLREYMECLTVSPFGSPPPSAADQGSEGGGEQGGEEPIYLVVDDAPTGCVTLNIDCLLHAVPELPAPASSSSSSFPSFSASQPFPRTATERFPFLLDPNQYACTPSSSSSSSGPTTITCLGRAAPILLEAAFTRLDAYHPSSPPSSGWEHHQAEKNDYGRGGGGGGMGERDSGIHTYSNAQLDMQDDFADLCAFYPSMRDGETCLDFLSGWLEYTQDYPLSSLAGAAAKRKKGKGGGGEKDKRRRRDHAWMEEERREDGEEEEVREAWRDDVLYWLYMEEIDFFSGRSKRGREGGRGKGVERELRRSSFFCSRLLTS